MTNAELQELSRLGAVQMLKEVQEYLAHLHKYFPELFAASTPPILVRAEHVNGNHRTSHAEAHISAPTRPKSMGAALRAEQATATPTKKRRGNGATWGTYTWHRIHDFLTTQPKHTAALSSIMPACQISSQASAITGMQYHKDLFKRVRQGQYRLVKTLTTDEKARYTSGS